MFSLKDYIKVLDRMKKVGEDLLDIDKESGGLLSSLEKQEDSKTNEMTNYTQDPLLPSERDIFPNQRLQNLSTTQKMQSGKSSETLREVVKKSLMQNQFSVGFKV